MDHANPKSACMVGLPVSYNRERPCDSNCSRKLHYLTHEAKEALKVERHSAIIPQLLAKPTVVATPVV